MEPTPFVQVEADGRHLPQEKGNTTDLEELLLFKRLPHLAATVTVCLSVSQSYEARSVGHPHSPRCLKPWKTIGDSQKNDTFVLQTKRWKTIGDSLNSNVLTVNNKF